jgi:hypothetical protein
VLELEKDDVRTWPESICMNKFIFLHDQNNYCEFLIRSLQIVVYSFYEDTSRKHSVVPRDLPKPLDLATRALGSFVCVGAVAACKVAAADAVDCLGKGSFVFNFLIIIDI